MMSATVSFGRVKMLRGLGGTRRRMASIALPRFYIYAESFPPFCIFPPKFEFEFESETTS